MQTPLKRRARCKENARSGGYLPCLLMLTVVMMINDITAASNIRPRSISWSYQSGSSLTFAFLQDLNSLPHLQSQTLSHWASEVADDCGENERDGKRWDPRNDKSCRRSDICRTCTQYKKKVTAWKIGVWIFGRQQLIFITDQRTLSKHINTK